MGKRGSNEYYQWRVFVDEPIQVLAQIKEVEYLLHPTFPQPSQVRSNPEDRFALESAGWGEFQILITIKYKDGREERGKYQLVLDPQGKPWPV